MSLAVASLAPPRRAEGLAEGWCEVALGEIVLDVVAGVWGAPEEAADADPERVRATVLRGAEFRTWERERGAGAAVRAVPRASLARRQLQAGDLVLEISGGSVGRPVGRTLLIDDRALALSPHPLVCSNFCRRLRLHPEVEPAFVQIALAHKHLAGELDELQTHTTNLRNLIVPRFLAEVVLALPPREEQRRIVAAVEALRAPLGRARLALARCAGTLTDLRRAVWASAYSGQLSERLRELPLADVAAALEEAYRRRRQAFAHACSEAEARNRRAPRRPRNLGASPAVVPEPLTRPALPSTWRLVALQDVIVRAQHGTSARADAVASRRATPILRMGNIQDGRIDLTDLKRISLASHELETFLLQRGDILFNRTNSPELVGKAAVYDREEPAVFASYLIRVEADQRLVLPRFLCGWINSPWGRGWARAVRSDCISQSNINASRLMTMPVPLPPLTEQEEIIDRVDALLARAVAADERQATAEELVVTLERTILDLALGGELVVPEAALARRERRRFEPAAELLARVRGDLGGAAEPLTLRVLAAIRAACWGAGRLSRGELARRVASRLGLTRRRAPALDRWFELARARGILGLEGDLYFGATPTFGRYDYASLIRIALTVLDGVAERERQDVTVAVAGHLGFAQVTAAMFERMERVYRWGEQNGVFALGEGTVASTASAASPRTLT